MQNLANAVAPVGEAEKHYGKETTAKMDTVARARPANYAPSYGPTDTSARIEVVDIVRGFALFGVLAINMSNWPHPKTTWLDQAVDGTVNFLFLAKSWPLFALLFGLGVAMQMDRKRQVALHVRRMVALFGFGLITLLLFAGNVILIDYATLGLLVVLLLRRAPASWLLVLAFCLLVASRSSPFWGPYIPGQDRVRAERAADLPLRVRGTFAEGVAARAREIPRFYAIDRVASQLGTFAMVVLGFWAGRKRLHQEIAENLPFFRRVFRWVLPVGVLGSAAVTFVVWRENWPPAATILFGTARMLSNDLQSIGYGVGIVLLARQEHWSGLLRPLASVGRVALTNFMTQFLVLRILFDRLALGLHWGKAVCLLVIVTIFAVQLCWSWLWLQRCHFGPAEWLWRTITYWKRQPMCRMSISG